MISVVLPTYNGEKYLSKSIDSILDQSYTDLELIIVDDCSKDSTPEIIRNYINKDKRVRSIRNETNRKLPASLNKGFGLSSGEYLTWTSDDNIYKPDALEKMKAYLDEHTCDSIVYCNMEYIDDEGKATEKESSVSGDIRQLFQWNVIGACFLYRREVHEKLRGYDENKFLIEDYDFWLRAALEYEYGFIPDILYRYRVHEKSLTAQRRKEIRQRTYEELKGILHSCPDKYKSALLRGLLEYAYAEENDKEYREFYNALKKSAGLPKDIGMRRKAASFVGCHKARTWFVKTGEK